MIMPFPKPSGCHLRPSESLHLAVVFTYQTLAKSFTEVMEALNFSDLCLGCCVCCGGIGGLSQHALQASALAA